MLLDLSSNFKNLDGKEIEGAVEQCCLANSLAGLLCGNTPGIAVIKAFDWAIKLHTEKQIEIDRVDLDLLEKLITDCQQLSNLGKAQFLKIMMKLKLDNTST